MEAITSSSTWTMLGGSTSSNPCQGATNYSGTPFFHTPSASEVNVVGAKSTGGYTILIGTAPGNNCQILEDLSTSGVISNIRVPSGIAPADGEIHASYTVPSRWIGCLTQTVCYKLEELNSDSMVVSQVADLSSSTACGGSSCANFNISLSDPATTGGAGWESSLDNNGYTYDNVYCGQLGPQNFAILAVCFDRHSGCAQWWRVDTGDMGGGGCWPSGGFSCTGCGITAPLNNPSTITSITGAGTTATGTCSASCTIVTGEPHVSIQGNTLFNGRELASLTVSGTTFTFASTVVGTASGGSIGQQQGLHGGGVCMDGTESLWSLNGKGNIVWEPGTSTLWHASSIDTDGHRACGMHTIVAGPSSTSADFWQLLDASVSGSSATNGAGKLANDIDGHYGWQMVDSADSVPFYAMNYCTQNNCPSANPTCPGCNEINMVQPASGGLTFRIVQTRKNVCANAGNLSTCAGVFFYDETSGNCSRGASTLPVLCIFNTGWADVSTGTPTLGQVTNGSTTLYRNDVVAVFMPQ
jgi:hypothetical protein